MPVENRGKKRKTHSQRQPKIDPLWAETRELLRRFDLQPEKRMGQHFLVNQEVLELIIQAAELTPTDTVIETGSGLGTLTKGLAREAGRVISIELDGKLAAILREILSYLPNVTIINDDILKIDPMVLIKEREAYKVVANLPYYITSPTLRHFLEAKTKPKTMVVMVQKEVAEDIVAKGREMSLLGLSVHFYGKPEIISYVGAECFYPAPEVDSAILKITTYPQPIVPVDNESDFFEVARAGFSASRKQIVNSLAKGLALPKAEALSLLSKAGISPKERPGNLTIDEWVTLWRVSSQRKEER